MRAGGAAQPTGSLGLEVTHADGSRTEVDPRYGYPPRLVDPSSRTHASVQTRTTSLSWRKLLGLFYEGLPFANGASRKVSLWRLRNLPNLWRGFRKIAVTKMANAPTMFGVLRLVVHRLDGTTEDLGVVSMRVVTTAGVNFLVDAFQNTTELENLKYHGLGTGTNAEATSDTALQTELTTEYSTDNVRPTGTTTEGASANVYRTVATITVDASVAATEHGVFSQAATGGGTLWDRTKFSVVNLSSGESITATYDCTFAAGG